MLEVAIIRFCWSPMGTFGLLKIPARTFTCYTVERPWLDNQPNVSCIPAGEYEIRKAMFYRSTPDPSDDYPVYEVMDVPDRTYIKIHRGNTMLDVKGCIALGKYLGAIESRWAVLSSAAAYTTFMEVMGGENRARLKIVNQAEFDWLRMRV